MPDDVVEGMWIALLATPSDETVRRAVHPGRVERVRVWRYDACLDAGACIVISCVWASVVARYREWRKEKDSEGVALGKAWYRRLRMISLERVGGRRKMLSECEQVGRNRSDRFCDWAAHTRSMA